MARMIFVNLPVENLERSKTFYEALGFTNEPKFTNDAAAMMVLSDTIAVMLLTRAFYSTFTSKPITNAHSSSEMLLCISCDSPAEVDRLTDAAWCSGGRVDVSPKQDMGVMYGRSFEDPDGHIWEPMWMNPNFAEQGAHPVEQAAA
ncbi:MAG: VOC family protein [Sphingomicrobium sp.]